MSRLGKRQICASPERMRDKEINCNKKTPLPEPKALFKEGRNFSVSVKGVKGLELISNFRLGQIDRHPLVLGNETF